MNFGIETQRSFVDTWECDENDHLNVQFYWQRFGDAARIFSHLANIEFQPWTDRHVRYHGELRASANIVVNSAGVSDKGLLVHRLVNGSNGELSATAVDRYENAVVPQDMRCCINEVPDEALPRSLPEEALSIINTAPLLERGTGLVSHRSVIAPAECDGDGNLLDRGHIARFSEAAAHLWHHCGMRRDFLQTRNLGSVAVEMKATRHAIAKSGMMVEVTSWLDSVGKKTFSFRHQVHDVESGSVLYCGAVVALLIDQKARKAVALPDDFIQV